MLTQHVSECPLVSLLFLPGFGPRRIGEHKVIYDCYADRYVLHVLLVGFQTGNKTFEMKHAAPYLVSKLRFLCFREDLVAVKCFFHQLAVNVARAKRASLEQLNGSNIDNVGVIICQAKPDIADVLEVVCNLIVAM